MDKSLQNPIRRTCLASVFLSLAYPSLLHAQQFPNKPIRFVVPFPPGGGNDLLARITSQKISESIGQPIVIENRSGASGQVGTEYVVRSAPDGYTMVTAGTPLTISQAAGKVLPYDALKDFTPISLMVLQPNVLVVHPSVPANTLEQLIALAKAKPGVLSYAVGSNGSAPHLAGELLKSMAGIDILHVPYNGAAPALHGLLAGQVTMAFDNPATSIPYIQSGKLRAIAVTSRTRAPQLPDVPAIAEVGLNGYSVDSWFGVVGPANMPKAIVDRLSSEFARALNLPEIKERLTQQGFTVVGGSADEFSSFIRNDIANWKKILTLSKVKLD
jgi:tripartite-type tricarboxylate transporter receptor subunit TctC